MVTLCNSHSRAHIYAFDETFVFSFPNHFLRPCFRVARAFASLESAFCELAADPTSAPRISDDCEEGTKIAGAVRCWCWEDSKVVPLDMRLCA